MSSRVAECAQKRHRWLWGRCPRRLGPSLCSAKAGQCLLLEGFSRLARQLRVQARLLSPLQPERPRAERPPQRAWRPSFSRCHRRLSTVRNLEIVFSHQTRMARLKPSIRFPSALLQVPWKPSASASFQQHASFLRSKINVTLSRSTLV